METFLKTVLSFVAAAIVFLWPTPTIEPVMVESLPLPVIVEVREVNDELKKIAWCESKNRQFEDDGSVHRGVINPQDTGKYQINEHYHLEASIALGMDIYTLEGNTEYAEYLYSTQGNTPWNWSKHCWGVDREWVEIRGEYWPK